jgi:hypothetical protein
MLKKIFIVVLCLVVIVVVLGMVMPNDYKVTRKVTINAEAARVHELTGDFKNWPKWAPWWEHDPSVKANFGEVTTGVGAHYDWTSDNGNGELTLTKSDPQTGIAYDMVFIDGDRRMPAKGWMNYTPSGATTEVEWGMEGKMEYAVIGSYFAMLSDTMMGGMFQQGLDKLKSICETK